MAVVVLPLERVQGLVLPQTTLRAEALFSPHTTFAPVLSRTELLAVSKVAVGEMAERVEVSVAAMAAAMSTMPAPMVKISCWILV